MAKRLTAGLPPSCDMDSGYVLRVTALDPSTGAVVPGVVLTNVVFLVRSLGLDTGGVDGTPLPLLVPTSETV